MKSVLITGSNGGVGRALCEEFSRAGYATIGLDITEEKTKITDHFIKMDLEDLVTSSKRHEELIAQIKKTKTELDCIIHNAATQILGKFSELKISDWTRTMNVNLLSNIVLTRLFLSDLEKNKGSVILIGSIHSRLTKPGFTAYAVSKSAIEGLTKALAVDLAGRVRVNGIMPAAIMTDMLKAGFEKEPAGLAALQSYHPSGVIGAPKEVAKLAVYLASESSPFMNGSIVEISGGIGSRLHDPSKS